ncbi:MAG TPA: glucokinase [Pyrinomonadaceae bacterium]
MILAGDIGGTKTNIALFDEDGAGARTPIAQRNFPSGSYDSLDAIVAEFVAEQKPDRITRACFGIAGPVVGDRVETPNLAWIIEGDKLARALGVESVALINDLEATAYGVEVLHDEQIFTLNEGTDTGDGHRGLIAAGTGLGMAGIFWDGARYRPMASEGGHIDFAPRNEIEDSLLDYMRREIGGRVSYERVLSGMGLVNVYQFLRDEGHGEEPDWLRERMTPGKEAAAISNAAQAGESELAAKALDLMVGIYGSMAGNLALLLKASGGLYVGGGIAPKILGKLKDGTFMRAYGDKGRMSELALSMPVRVILDDKTALYGAARRAALGG